MRMRKPMKCQSSQSNHMITFNIWLKTTLLISRFLRGFEFIWSLESCTWVSTGLGFESPFCQQMKFFDSLIQVLLLDYICKYSQVVCFLSFKGFLKYTDFIRLFFVRVFQVFYSSMPGNSPFCHRLQILVYRYVGCLFSPVFQRWMAVSQTRMRGWKLLNL